MRLKITLMLLAFAQIGSYAQSALDFTDDEKAVYDANKKDVKKRAKLAASDAYAKCCMEFKVLKSMSGKLSKLMLLRESRKEVYDYIYPDKATKRVTAKKQIDSVFQDTINSILIPYNYGIAGENISFALRYNKMLKLDEAQYGYLKNNAVGMARKKAKNPRKNYYNDEINLLRKTLSDKQLNSFLVHKNGMKVTKKVRDTWAKIKLAGLENELDSAKDCAKAYMYYFEQQKINDLFKHYGTSRKAKLADLAKRMPKIIKMADAINKREKQSGKKNAGKNDFVW